jgi:outer membrane murein-binding lipoprotein Lpp
MNHPSQMPPSQPRRPHQPLLPVELELSLSSELTDLLTRFVNILESSMSQLSDAISAAKQAVLDAIARVQTDVDALNAKVTELQAKVDAGGATPQDLQDLADLKALADALDPTKPATLPPDSGTVTPVPAPAPTDGTPPTPPTP